MFRYVDQARDIVEHVDEGWTIDPSKGVYDTQPLMIFKEWLDEGGVVLPPIEATNEQIMEGIRLIRNDRLKESDWTQMPGALSETARANWDTYRQALRDLPSTITNPKAWDIEDNWPVKPE